MTRRLVLLSGLGFSALGCSSLSRPLFPPTPAAPPPIHHHPVETREKTIQPVQAEVVRETPPETASRRRPAYALQETLPIDLPTVIRLVDANSPTVGLARAKVREAQAKLDSANVQWLPNLTLGAAYTRFDGQTQNQRGDVFGLSRSNLFFSGGPALSLDFAEAVYRPLIERRQTSAEQLRSTAASLGAELEAVAAYLDLVHAHALLAINADTLSKDEEMLATAERASQEMKSRTTGDVSRAKSEVLLRRIERAELQGRIDAASVRLGRMLLLQPTVKLVPAEATVTPLTLIEPTTTLDELLDRAASTRPDLAAHREAISAARVRLRRYERGPLLPRLAIGNQTGSFGGGLNGNVENFSARNALTVQLTWEVKNLGFGNRADAAERRALLDQAMLQLNEAQARAFADIVETTCAAAARSESLGLAEEAIKEAEELYRLNKDGNFTSPDGKTLFDALRPFQAILVLNQARQAYLNAVIESNRAQFRLLALTGISPGAMAVPTSR